MANEELRRLAQRMLADQDARTPGQLRQQLPDLTIPQAYELQSEVVRLREQRGEKVIGYKVGCTSRPIREQLGVAEPIFGRIFDTGCFPSGIRLSHAHYANLAVEGELAVRLAGDLVGALPVTDEGCLEAVESVFPVIELHHYVLHGVSAPGPELIATNGMHAGFVLADAETACRGPASLVHGLSIHVNGEMLDATGDSELVARALGSLRWLAGRLAQFGMRLSKGQVILTGSPMKLHSVGPGSTIIVTAPPLGKSCAEIGL